MRPFRAGGARADRSSDAPAGASPANARRPIILVPGLLGSQLCRPDPSNPGKSILAWGALGALPYLSKLQLPPDGKDDIRPCGLVREVVFFGLYRQGVYSPVIAHLERLGYRENRDLFIFDYDWRHIALRPDPTPLDPTNPFEKSVVGQFSAGTEPGMRTLRVTVFVEGGPPRIVERPIGVIVR